MIIKFFTVNKRENSTFTPSGTGYEYDCILKESTSVVKPDILIDFADQENPAVHLYNYAYIPVFNRYYFVADQKCVRGMLWEYSLTCDILATYKGVISASELYLLRCSTLFDGDVVDTYYPIKTNYTTASHPVLTPWFQSGSEVQIDLGTFIIGIASKPGLITDSYFGSVKYVALTRSELCKLVDYLMDAQTLTNWSISLDGVTAEAAKALIDPLQFIKSCQWSPIMYGSISGSEQTGLSIWSWSAPGVRYKNMPAAPPYITYTIDFSVIPRHPQAARGGYLNSEPYTKMSVCVPPFGMIELDTTLTAKATHIICKIIYDLITGVGILEIHYDTVTGPPACRLQSQIGVPVQLTQVYNDYISSAGGVTGGILGTIGSALTGNIGGAIQGGVAAITSAANAIRPIQSSIGGNGGYSDLDGYATLYAVFYTIPDEDRSHVGRPLCDTVAMSSVGSGAYCLALDGDLPISGTAGEQQRLKEYLETGFYYE